MAGVVQDLCADYRKHLGQNKFSVGERVKQARLGL